MILHTMSDAPPAATEPAPPIAPPDEPGRRTPPKPPTRKFDRSIVEGPLRPAVWKLAWPTMLTNMIGGLQGIVDHVLVGNLVGFRGNAAIGVSNQIFIIVIVFIASLFTGMSVLVARYVGAGDAEKADRTVYQAFITALFIALGIMAPVGIFLSPYLLDFVNAAPGVKAEALPFLRIMFACSSGMLLFFMISGALRAAGDARTPMVYGLVMTVANILLNIVFISGLGPIPAMGTAGSAIGTAIASISLGLYATWRLWHGGWVVRFPRGASLKPDWEIIRALFRFGLPTGIQGIAMNVGGVLMLSIIGSLRESAAAQAAFAIAYGQLFSLITWTSQGLLGAAATMAGQNLGAGNVHRAEHAVHVAARYGALVSAGIGLLFLFFPEQLLGVFGVQEAAVLRVGVPLLRVLSVSGIFIALALTYTGGLQGTGDTRSPLFISIISQVAVPLGICYTLRGLGVLEPLHVWLAILAGHVTRCGLSVLRFNQGKWRSIAVT